MFHVKHWGAKAKNHTQGHTDTIVLVIRDVSGFGCGFVTTASTSVSYKILFCSKRDVCEMALRGKIAISTLG